MEQKMLKMQKVRINIVALLVFWYYTNLIPFAWYVDYKKYCIHCKKRLSKKNLKAKIQMWAERAKFKQKKIVWKISQNQNFEDYIYLEFYE